MGPAGRPGTVGPICQEASCVVGGACLASTVFSVRAHDLAVGTGDHGLTHADTLEAGLTCQLQTCAQIGF